MCCRCRADLGGHTQRVLYNRRFGSDTREISVGPIFGGLVAQAEIGIIGGSGLYAMPGLSKVKEVRVKTPFGAPSDAYVCGML